MRRPPRGAGELCFTAELFPEGVGKLPDSKKVAKFQEKEPAFKMKEQHVNNQQ